MLDSYKLISPGKRHRAQRKENNAQSPSIEYPELLAETQLELDITEKTERMETITFSYPPCLALHQHQQPGLMSTMSSYPSTIA